MITITNENIKEYKNKFTSKVVAKLSNWDEFVWYRATLYAIIKRWYYKWNNDKIHYANIDSNLYIE